MTYSQHITDLLESFAFAFSPYGQYSEVFVNNDRKEWLSLGHDIKFIIDARERKLYTFPGDITNHDWVAQRLHKNLLSAWVYFGDATADRQGMHVDRFSLKPSLINDDLSWTRYYDLPLEEYIKTNWFPSRPLPDWIVD